MKGAFLPAWEHFQHDADIGVRGSGRTLAEAFEQAALVMTAVIVEPETVEGSEIITLSVSAPDVELLLTEWLNALIYEMATRRMLFARFQVELRGLELQGRTWRLQGCQPGGQCCRSGRSVAQGGAP